MFSSQSHKYQTKGVYGRVKYSSNNASILATLITASCVWKVCKPGRGGGDISENVW